MFVNTFIQRPILASVCSLVIILAGIVAIPTMPVAQYPALAPPQISVAAVYTGANAQEVESAVTTPLEQAINGVEGMLYMSSSSTNSGFASINVTFDITRDQDLAQVDVQNRVSQALGRLPTEVRALGVTVNKQNTGFVMAAGVFAEKGEYDSLFLSNYIDVYVKDALKRLPDAPDFDNIIVKAGNEGSLVRLKDVGRAELGAETYSAELRFQGQEAVGFGVIQLPPANALDVSRKIGR